MVSRVGQNTVHKVRVLEAFLWYSKPPNLFYSLEARHGHVSVGCVVVHQLQVLHPFAGRSFRSRNGLKTCIVVFDRRMRMPDGCIC